MRIDEIVNTIICGDALDILKTFPDESINCVVTSPPYWGLRDYGLESTIWDSNNDCVHEWGDKLERAGYRSNDNNPGKLQSIATQKRNEGQKSQFCLKCGAWRGQLGLEPVPELYVQHLTQIFDEIKRVLKKDGTIWLNLGDSYISGKSRYSTKEQTLSGKLRGEPINKKPDQYYHPFLKDKDLAGIPWRIAFSLQEKGWYLRSDIIWHKPNPMPESVKDRPTKAHEYIFLLTKTDRYYYDAESIYEIASGYDGRKSTFYNGGKKDVSIGKHERWPKRMKNLEYNGQANHSFHKSRAIGMSDKEYQARNKRTVWTVSTKPYPEAHFAVFPSDLIIDCIKAGCPENGIVLDPFIGSGTTAEVATKLNRNYIGIELKPGYIELANKRLFEHKKQLKLV